jgi:phosphopantothenoylcysteine decarboxylase/phosphopantothenate--cysteine ligase
MNRAMWQNSATADNVHCLEARGVRLLGPAEGEQACGETGYGRMLEPLTICETVEKLFSPGALAGLSILISAGPTREPIDPVRYISNRSSGKMGYALAEAAVAAGANVTLISGPVNLPAPQAAELVKVETAQEMYEAVLARACGHDIYIGAAAVADYAPVAVAESKIKKRDQEMVLNLARTKDILGAVSAMQDKPFTVGFAAETDRLEDYARQKLQAKALDMIAANQVGQAQGGFDSDDNALQVFWNGGEAHLAMAPKTRIATRLIELITKRYYAKNTDQNPG